MPCPTVNPGESFRAAPPLHGKVSAEGNETRRKTFQSYRMLTGSVQQAFRTGGRLVL